MEKGILTRMISSIPIVGTALALWLEHTQLGMAQHGKFLGLLRGLLVGLVIAATLIVASEAVIAVFDVGRFWLSAHVTSAIKTKIMVDKHEAYTEWALNQVKPQSEPTSKQSSNILAGQKTPYTCQPALPVRECGWSVLMPEEKMFYVIGIHDAVGTAWLRELYREGRSYADTVERLDKFYANTANAGVPVIDAMREVRGN